MKGGAEDNSVTFVSGHSFGGGWEVQAMSPRGLVRAGAELCVSGERFGEGETQQVGQATPSTDEISQASNGGAVGRIWGDVTEEVASRLEQSKSDQPNFLGRKGLSTSPLPIRAHDRLVSEDVVSLPRFHVGWLSNNACFR